MKIVNKKTAIFLCICLVCGVLLVTFDGNGDNKNSEDVNSGIKTYEDMFESRLESLISSCEGVSDVNVMVILKSGVEYLYAQNSEENDGSVRRQYYNAGDREALLLKEVSPEFSGVAVVCKGADNAVTKHKIIELISSVTGLSAGKIYVGS